MMMHCIIEVGLLIFMYAKEKQARTCKDICLNVLVAGDAVFFYTTTHLYSESSWDMHNRKLCSK